MASTFPTSIQSLTNVQDGVDYPKAADINDLNDTVEALEAKVGIDDSAVSTSIDYIINNKIWPIGSVFTAVVATDPATLLGFGIWSQIAGGKVLVGQTDGDADFNSAEETGGAKTHTLTTAEMPTHTHTQDAHTHTQNAHSHAVYGNVNSGSYTGIKPSAFTSLNADQSVATNSTTAVNQNTTAVNQNTGSGSAHSTMNPYLVVYFWKRTA